MTSIGLAVFVIGAALIYGGVTNKPILTEFRSAFKPKAVKAAPTPPTAKAAPAPAKKT